MKVICKFSSLFTVAAATLSLVLFLATTHAEVPGEVSYQGVLLDEDGIPSEGPVDLLIRFYDGAVDGNIVFEEEHNGVELTRGVYSIKIGTGLVPGTEDSTGGISVAPNISQLWLAVTVNNGEELMPRTGIGSVIFAIKSEFSESLINPTAVEPAVIVDSSSNVGIGTDDPSVKLEVDGEIKGFGTIPVGGVIMWWGELGSWPSNFELCDGGESADLGHSRPDFRDRFVKGAPDGKNSRSNLSIGGNHNLPNHHHSLGDLSASTTVTLLNGKHTHAVDPHLHRIPLGQGDRGTRDMAADGHDFDGNRGSTDPANLSISDAEANVSVSSAVTSLSGRIGGGGVNADGDISGANQPAFLEMFFIIRVR